MNNNQIQVVDSEIFDSKVVDKKDIKTPYIDASTIDIIPGQIYVILCEDDNKYYLENIPTIFNHKARKWDVSEIIKYCGPQNRIGSLARDIKEIVLQKKYGHLPVYIDDNYELWVRGNTMWADKYNHRARSKD